MEPKGVHSIKVKKCNYKADRFWFIIKDINDWMIFTLIEGNSQCICGTKLKRAVILRHKHIRKQVIVGLDCAARIGFSIKYDTPADYLALAYKLARSPNAKQFVRSLQDKLVKFKRKLKISKNQKDWLQAIVGVPWQWSVW